MGSVGKASGGATSSSSTTNDKLAKFMGLSVEDAGAFAHQAYKDTETNDSAYLAQGMNCYNTLQGLVERLDLHGKPVVLSDADYDSQLEANALNGVEIYRGLGHVSNNKYQQQFLFGDKTYIGDGIHGEGIYMTTSQQYASDYASSDHTMSTVTGFIDKSKARVITESEIKQMMQDEKIFHKGFGLNEYTAYALHKGYNVIHVPGGNGGESESVKSKGNRIVNGIAQRGNDFYIPLTREVLVMREHSRMGQA